MAAASTLSTYVVAAVLFGAAAVLHLTRSRGDR